MNIIGQRIKKLREEKGITQETMASQLDVTQSNYGRLEKDDRRLNVVKLLKIARILNINISYLFNEVAADIDTDDNQSLNNANKEVYNILVDSLRAEIQHLKDEINFLRIMVKS
ncbi:MAG: XRE family transcriptional regulator [Flavobacterium psychrophilum]|nr:MAG: XRE family transcriptional regulator [Flavobacterium psychrophilum]